MRIACCLALLGACGFTPGEGPGDAPGTGSGDATDAPPGGRACIDAWTAGPTFSAPMPVANVSSTGDEADPFVTGDELSLYVVRGGDIYVATRTSKTLDFETPHKDDALSSTANDTKLSLTGDGMAVFINSTRTGTVGATDIFYGERTADVDAFTWTQKYMLLVNNSGDQWDPQISANGLALYYAPTGSPQTLVVAKRATTTDSFGAPQVIMELDSDMVDNDPAVSGDERLIVFASNRGGNRNLWYATRPSANVAFGPARIVPQLNAGTEDGATLSADACHLYFISDRSGNADIYVAAVL